MKNRFGKFGDVFLVLALGAQGGLLLAVPVLGGLALGYWLDLRFNSLPWITLISTLIGAVLGPLLLYRWMNTVVKERMAQKTEKNQDEENKA